VTVTILRELFLDLTFFDKLKEMTLAGLTPLYLLALAEVASLILGKIGFLDFLLFF